MVTSFLVRRCFIRAIFLIVANTDGTRSLTCCSNVKSESSVKPPFLTVSQQRIQKLPKNKPKRFNCCLRTSLQNKIL